MSPSREPLNITREQRSTFCGSEGRPRHRQLVQHGFWSWAASVRHRTLPLFQAVKISPTRWFCRILDALENRQGSVETSDNTCGCVNTVFVFTNIDWLSLTDHCLCRSTGNPWTGGSGSGLRQSLDDKILCTGTK